jgi:phosphate transport system protein
MRQTFHEQLDSLTHDLEEMTRLVGSAMARAATALLDADLQLAETVIAADEAVNTLYHGFEATATDLLARQQPVATDLRRIVTGLRISSDLERMGDLARHVAKVARLRYPASAVPADTRGIILEMSQVAELICIKTGDVIASRDVKAALQLERDDDEMDRLHRELYQRILDDSWQHGIEAAIDLTLVGRYFERYADHAVSVARRVVYLVTGEYATPDAAGV